MEKRQPNKAEALTALQTALKDKTEYYLNKARQLYSQFVIRPVDVAYDLNGARAAVYQAHNPLIRYNLKLASQNLEDYLSQTVAHEVAHHISQEIASARHRRIKPHGVEWQAVMRSFGLNPLRCHDYDVSNAGGKRQRRFQYVCDCRGHQLSATRHYRIMRGDALYYCKYCRSALTRKTTSQLQNCKA